MASKILKGGYAVLKRGKLIDGYGLPMQWREFAADFDAHYRMPRDVARDVARKHQGIVVSIGINVEIELV